MRLLLNALSLTRTAQKYLKHARSKRGPILGYHTLVLVCCNNICHIPNCYLLIGRARCMQRHSTNEKQQRGMVAGTLSLSHTHTHESESRAIQSKSHHSPNSQLLSSKNKHPRAHTRTHTHKRGRGRFVCVCVVCVFIYLHPSVW
jgi:hypothetical protein